MLQRLSMLSTSVMAASLLSTLTIMGCASVPNSITDNNRAAAQGTPTLIAPNQATEQVNTDFSALLDAIWAYENGQNTENTTPAALLPNISPAYKAQRAAQFNAYLTQVKAFPDVALSIQEQISKTMQIYRLQNYVDEYRFQEYLVPITSEYGFHSSMLNLAYRFDFSQLSEYQRYIDTMRLIPQHFAQQIDYMRQGIAIGKVQPKVVMQGFEESVAAIIQTNPEDSQFFQPFKNLKNTLPNTETKALEGLINAAKTVILEDVNQAYQTFYDFLVNVYIPQAKTDIAAKTWPDGTAFYNNRIKHYTTLDMSAQEIHNIGLQEVSRIRADMQKVLDTLGYQGSINDFINFLRTDAQFYADSPEALLKHAMYLSKRMDALLPKLFKQLPRTPYGVAPVPDSIAPKYTTGRYISPRNDTEPGYYWVNTYALNKRPLYALPALTLHEAVPGHHLQISLAKEMQDLPKVRQNTYISAFGEGWGLYSEYLGKEVGFYETPYDEFGALSYEMWRACRLVVDTGMHMFGWTRQQAVDFMLENTALSEHNVNTEIDRYISWPGQALSYKLGEIKIKELRQKAETELGEDFDVREFHHAILEYGSVPLAVLEKNIERFIQQKKTALNLPNASAGMLRTLRDFRSDFVADRNVHIWLPEQYHSMASQGQEFAVVYMHDGQMLFDEATTWNKKEWGVDEISQKLITNKDVRPFIVVGIDNGGDALRYPEYMPQTPYTSLTEEQQQHITDAMSLQAPIQSDAYLKFIVNELKPYIDQNFSTSQLKEDTFIAGASMGGLISWYAVAKYPDIFGGCLCMSTHFIGGPDVNDDTIFKAFKDYMANNLPVNGSHFLYFDYGDQTLDQYYPPFHQKLSDFFQYKQADPKTVIIHFFPGDAHDEIAWQKRLPQALKLALNTKLQ